MCLYISRNSNVRVVWVTNVSTKQVDLCNSCFIIETSVSYVYIRQSVFLPTVVCPELLEINTLDCRSVTLDPKNKLDWQKWLSIKYSYSHNVFQWGLVQTLSCNCFPWFSSCLLGKCEEIQVFWVLNLKKKWLGTPFAKWMWWLLLCVNLARSWVAQVVA